MPVIKYRDPSDGQFKEITGPAGPTGPTGPAGPAGGTPNGGMPIGAIMPYAGATAPAGWHLCDGSTHGSAALQAVIGTTTTPNLRDKFIKASGPTHALGATGGAATVTLTAAQTGLVGHNHTGTVAAHTHSVDFANTTSGNMSAASSHTHTAYGSYAFGLLLSGQEKREGTGTTHKTINASTSATGGTTVANSATALTLSHTHSLDIAAFNSTAASGTPSIAAVAAANATAAHNNLPPYYALTLIIKVA